MPKPQYVLDWRVKNKVWFKRTPGLKALASKILADTYIVYGEMSAMTNAELQDIADNGKVFSGRGVLEITGEQSHCHLNVAKLYKSKRVDTIVTGFALSKDGLWREHTWGLKGGRVIETTERRVQYYGKVLCRAEALEFVDNELW